MLHLVPDEGVDTGPLLALRDLPLIHGESLEAFEARAHQAEHDLLVEYLSRLSGTGSLPFPETGQPVQGA
jgi:phosphoribosylglycinamide formyltransferase-1